MERIELCNPFNAPVYYEQSLSSTMITGRLLAADGAPSGTVIAVGFQDSGRGRQSRIWNAEKDQNLLFTVFLEYNDFSAIPKALTLRTGLAAALAVENFIPEFAGLVKVKWPNDLMLCKNQNACKTAGILAESDGSKVFIGIGINLLQCNYPPELRGKAGSLLSFFKKNFPDKKIPDSLNPGTSPEKLNEKIPFTEKPQSRLLEKILVYLKNELINPQTSWKKNLEERLYKLNESVIFAQGAADSQNLIQGRLTGINEAGELLILPDGEAEPRPFINGELRIY